MPVINVPGVPDGAIGEAIQRRSSTLYLYQQPFRADVSAVATRRAGPFASHHDPSADAVLLFRFLARRDATRRREAEKLRSSTLASSHANSPADGIEGRFCVDERPLSEKSLSPRRFPRFFLPFVRPSVRSSSSGLSSSSVHGQ
jgi:hypothetical protein